MKYNKIIRYILIGTVTLAMTACGGSGGGSSTSSPEKILENSLVKEALQAAKDNGMNIRTDLGHNPPNLTGYYNNYIGGTLVATESGRDIGRSYVASESRVNSIGEQYEEVNVAYANGNAISYESIKGSFLRGEGNYFTIYSEYKDTCTEAGSNYTISGINITSAVRNPQSGAISDKNHISVRLKFSGKLTSACDERYSGGGKNKWSVGRLPSSTKIDHASDLTYMCVDDNKAYIPNETWTNSNKQSCKCTTEYEVECK